MSTALESPGDAIVVTLETWRGDAALLAAAEACVRATREAFAASRRAVPAAAEALAHAREAVSAEALARLLDAGRDVHGLATDEAIGNVVPFNAAHVTAALHSQAVARARRRLDAAVAGRVAAHFGRGDLEVIDSGHFLYPPGAYLGWHTNSGHPGWRLYVTHAEEPGRSFFRYRDPRDGRISTSPDEVWSFRLFCVTAEAPLWHALYSETHRTSFGYVVAPRRFGGRLVRRMRPLLRRLGGRRGGRRP